MELSVLLPQVISVAKEAGNYLRRERVDFNLDRVERKHAHDYVSYVDKTSEEIIVRRLREILPEAGFLTEEGSASHENEPFWWVIDPLDGTTNFIHNNQPYAVCIGLRNAEEILLGVVYDVSNDECFSAYSGGGAFLNDKSIKVSDKPLDEALLGIELPYDADRYRETALRLISYFYGRCGAIRMNGSAALAICQVAAGRWDGWIERYIGQWDFMAAGIVLREAGGIMTDLAGNAACLNGGDIVVSNGIIHDQLIDRTRLEV